MLKENKTSIILSCAYLPRGRRWHPHTHLPVSSLLMHLNAQPLGHLNLSINNIKQQISLTCKYELIKL